MSQAKALSVRERIQRVQAMWDEIAQESADVEITDAQRAELDRRLEAHKKSPEECTPWEIVRNARGR